MADGSVVVAWHDGDSLRLRIFGSDGVPQTAEQEFEGVGDLAYFDLFELSNGNIVATWTQEGQNADIRVIDSALTGSISRVSAGAAAASVSNHMA